MKKGKEAMGVASGSGVTRRGLLKVLAAAGGTAAVASALPERWIRPLVERGATPAHAQTSGANPVVSNLEVGELFNSPPLAEYGTAIPMLVAGFDYLDPLGELDDTATLSAELDSCGAILYTDKPLSQLIGYNRMGDAESGSIGFAFPHLCNGVIGELCVSLQVNGRSSALVCSTYNTMDFLR
jgi:hypothetical protein